MINYFLTFSLQKNKPITIIYLSNDGKVSQRKVLVKKIGHDKMIAYCFLRHHIRTFTLNNVLSADHTAKSTAV
ncbi:hypothetical protein [Metabacillus litoralis]|uniref:hypothetical protein n=1 Tax=Metabacillus litoralis TaxID=152268 RepID=UPI001CFCB90A|nr:hypothetical protein [Metabacillus litoralis]